MSRENVEVVRRALELLNHGDLESALVAIDREVEWTTSLANPEGPVTYRGHAGLRELWSWLREDFEEIAMVPDDVRAVGDEVIVLGHTRVRGRGSGAVTQSQRAWIVGHRERKVVRVRTYSEHSEALEAMGLSE
jgi:ketosteroid isomerase-like protein